MQHPDLVQVDPVQMDEVWTLYRTHPTVGSCMQAISNFIFGNGLTFKESIKVPPIVQRAYHRTAYNALEWLFCVGVVPVALQTLPGYAKLVPIVPVPEAVDIFVRVTSTGDRIYQASFKRNFNMLSHFGATGTVDGLGGNSATTKVIVWNGGTHPPTCNGRLVTPMTHLQVSEEFVNFAKRKYMIAEQIKSNPPIVTQSRTTRGTDADGVAWGIDEKTLQLADEQNVQRAENRAHQQFLQHATWGRSSMPSSKQDLDEFHAETRPHEYFVAEERDATRVDLPNTASNLQEIIRWSEEKIFQIFGMPFGMFSNTGVNIQSNKMQEFCMNRNINRYRSTIEKFLNDVFNLTQNISTNLHDVTTSTEEDENYRGGTHTTTGGTDNLVSPKKRQRTGIQEGVVRVVTENDNNINANFESFQKGDVGHTQEETLAITLIPTPLTSPTEIQALLSEQMLTRKEAINLVRVSLGLDPITHAPPVSGEHKNENKKNENKRDD